MTSSSSISGPLGLAVERQLCIAGIPHAHQRVLEGAAIKDRRRLREQRGQVRLFQR